MIFTSLPALPVHQPRTDCEAIGTSQCGRCQQPLFTGEPIELTTATSRATWSAAICRCWSISGRHVRAVQDDGATVSASGAPARTTIRLAKVNIEAEPHLAAQFGSAASRRSPCSRVGGRSPVRRRDGRAGHRALDVDASGTLTMQGLLGTTLILLAACSLAAMRRRRSECPPCWGISLSALYWPLSHRRDRAGGDAELSVRAGVALLLFMVGLEFSLGDFWLPAGRC